MMMEGIGSEVELVIKAANQLTEDMKIRASSAWTVRDLKTHLSQVHPTKPRTEDQKIIYSGQLLSDSSRLQDVLRAYADRETHTVHLVCSARMQQPAANTGDTNRTTTNEDGVRRRNVANGAPQNAESPVADVRNDQQVPAQLLNYYAYMMGQPGRLHPVYLDEEHAREMQRAYDQYARQVAAMWRDHNANAEAYQPPNQVEEAPPQEAAALEEPIVPRDWLDSLYAVSRLAVLASLLYLYSSPLRLAMVVLLLAAGYLYQMGYFPIDRQNERARGNPRENENVPQNGVPNAEPVPENGPNPERPVNNENGSAQQQSVLGATWMIILSFFTSLIPETPNVV